jgi:hypothetical protein
VEPEHAVVDPDVVELQEAPNLTEEAQHGGGSSLLAKILASAAISFRESSETTQRVDLGLLVWTTVTPSALPWPKGSFPIKKTGGRCYNF